MAVGWQIVAPLESSDPALPIDAKLIESVADDLVRPLAVHVHNKADTTGVVFVGGVVQSLTFRKSGATANGPALNVLVLIGHILIGRLIVELNHRVSFDLSE